MRNGLIGLVSAMALASIAPAGCSDYSSGAGTGGTASTMGGSSSTGGNASSTGGQSAGGAATGGSSAATGGSSAATGGSSAATGGSSAATGGSSGSGASVTTLSGTMSLGSLTAAEATQLCNDAYAYFGQAISRATLCKATGLTTAVSSSAPTDAAMQQFCTDNESICLQASPNSPSCGDIPTPCTVTVAQYSTCIVDKASAYNQGVNGLASCATVGRADLPAIWDFVTANPPASCTALDATCAGLDVPTPH